MSRTKISDSSSLVGQSVATLVLHVRRDQITEERSTAPFYETLTPLASLIISSIFSFCSE